MYVTYNKAENARVLSDCAWIADELENDFGGQNEACCESFAAVTHIATLSGRNEHPQNQYAAEIIRDHGFGREYTYRAYKVGEFCEWKDIREELFNELLEHVHA
jgi:hypothetical protein